MKTVRRVESVAHVRAQRAKKPSNGIVDATQYDSDRAHPLATTRSTFRAECAAERNDTDRPKRVAVTRHHQARWKNNRIEGSRVYVRRLEQRMQGFRSPRAAQRFLHYPLKIELAAH